MGNDEKELLAELQHQISVSMAVNGGTLSPAAKLYQRCASTIERLSAIEQERDALREALHDVARQKLSAEVEDYEAADWLGGYDVCIERARAALLHEGQG